MTAENDQPDRVIDEFVDYLKTRVDLKMSKICNTICLYGNQLEKSIKLQSNLQYEIRTARRSLVAMRQRRKWEGQRRVREEKV